MSKLLPGKTSTRRPHGRRTRRDDRVPDTDAPYIIYGLHAGRAALMNPARRIHRVLTTENARRRLGEDAFALHAIEPEITTSAALERLLGRDAVHQGCAVECDPLDHATLDTVAQAQRVIALDQVTDPHNVGAIIRTAAAFAMDALVLTTRHSPRESGVLAKSASGGLEQVPLVRVRNLATTLEERSAAGYAVIGLDSAADMRLEEISINGPFVLVLGAEGKGLRQRTRAVCTHLARLDLPGEIVSLNVSNAAALTLYIATQASPTE